jgi:hypothetical protein
VLAVGIGAINKEFLIPYIARSFFRISQLYPFLGKCSHKSKDNNPFDAGDPG